MFLKFKQIFSNNSSVNNYNRMISIHLQIDILYRHIIINQYVASFAALREKFFTGVLSKITT